MMNPPCTVMVEKVLPELRKRVAIVLKERGWPQKRIAEAVGVSQPMVSRYLSSEREILHPSLEEDMSRAVDEIVNLMLSGAKEAEIIGALCEFCMEIREKGLLCTIHPVESCRVCMNLRSSPRASERRKLMEEFRGALKMIEGRIPEKIVPEVRINMAAALSGAKSREEVIAIPGRLVEINGELRALTEPEFGASRHLSSVLLNAMKVRKDIRAVVNIAFNEEVGRALKKLGIGFDEFNGEDVPENWKSSCLLDPGGYGREPCLYIFGDSPESVATLLRKIADEVKE